MGPIAFYAPLKSPNHPVPSGERQIARNLITALQTDAVGRLHDVVLVSELRSFDKLGDAARQADLLQAAEREIAELITRGRREAWAGWVTYHNYYKAPDLLGPAVCRALGLPYVSIEATRASKRLGGPWDAFERQAAAACDAADVLFHFTDRDAVALRDHQRAGQRIVSLSPFLAQESLPKAAQPEAPTVLIAGMMRAGDKLASYEIAAQALADLPGAWQVEIAGDGPKRAEVEALMAPFGARVRFLGQLDDVGMAVAYHRARVFLWPGVNEAFGMVYLEAQARGVPVVAQDRPGVNEVVDPAGLCPQNSPEALAQSLSAVLDVDATHARRVAAAQERMHARHLLGAARQTLWDVLGPMMKETR